MAKESKDKACYLDMPPGLHGINYNQKFVRAPMSLHPKKQNSSRVNVEHSEALRVTEGK